MKFGKHLCRMIWNKTGKRWLAVLLCCMLLRVVLPAEAVSYYTRAPWVLDSWSEIYPVDAWGENSIVEQLAGKEQLPSAQERTIWVSGWIELSTGAYGDVCRLVWEGQVPGLTVSGEVGRDAGGNTGYPDECFTSTGSLRIRCGFPVTMAKEADAAQLIHQFLTQCNPRLVITNEDVHTKCEYSPEIGLLVTKEEEQYWQYLTLDELTRDYVVAMEQNIPTGVGVHIKEIAELNDSDLQKQYSDWLCKELIYDNRCWKIVFQLDPTQEDSIRLAAPFVRDFNWDLFIYGTQEKPLFFLADFEFARVDENGQFMGYLTTRVDDLTLGSLYDWLQSMDFGFLLSTEPLMVVDHTYVNAWNGIGWLK